MCTIVYLISSVVTCRLHLPRTFDEVPLTAQCRVTAVATAVDESMLGPGRAPYPPISDLGTLPEALHPCWGSGVVIAP